MRYGFFEDLGKCDEFSYGGQELFRLPLLWNYANLEILLLAVGCGGNGNRFESLSACLHACVDPTTPQTSPIPSEECLQPLDTVKSYDFFMKYFSSFFKKGTM